MKKLLARARKAWRRFLGRCMNCQEPRIGEAAVVYFPHLTQWQDYCYSCARQRHRVLQHTSNYDMGPRRRMRAVR